jgi:hypothetical protein
MAEWADGSAVLVRTLAHGLREWMALIGARVLLKK